MLAVRTVDHMILPIDSDAVADLDRVGTTIDRDGIDAVPRHILDGLATDAKTLGIRTVAADVLVNPNDPAVARERAFSLIACGLIGARARRLATPTMEAAS